MSKKAEGPEKSLWRLAVALARTRLINATRKAEKKRGFDYDDSLMSQREDNSRYWASYDPNRFAGGGAIGGVAYGHTISFTGEGQESAVSVETENARPMENVAITPKQALAELGRMPTHFSLEGLDDKISMFEKKRSLITQHYAAEDVDRMLTCLRNRKKYDSPMADGQTPRQFFGLFDTTTHDLIDDLLAKHKNLVFKEAELFIPELPEEATKTMSTYTAKCKELTGKEPKFYVIATKESFKEADRKRDPILVAPSPFFFGYDILGAWDTEMLYLPEL